MAKYIKQFFGRPFGRGCAGAVFLAVTWEAATWLFAVPDSVAPSFHRVMLALFANFATIWQELAFTALESVIAWLTCLVVAGLLASAMTLSETFENIALYPLLAVQNVPKVAITPLVVILVGHGKLPIVVLGVLVAFFPVFEGFRVGLKRDRTGLRVVFGPLCRSKWRVFRLIKLPEAMPSILNGARVGMTMSVVGVLVGELGIPDRGLGKLIADGTELYRYDMQFASVLAASVLGIFLYGIVCLLEDSKLLARFQYTASSIAGLDSERR